MTKHEDTSNLSADAFYVKTVPSVTALKMYITGSLKFRKYKIKVNNVLLI
jgi:hypothetical protein